MRITKWRLELVKEETSEYEVTDTKLTSPQTVVRILNEVFKMESQSEEVFVMMCLDTKNRVVGTFEVSRGSVSAAVVHPREVLKRAILCNASSIIVAHNHPSGEVTPSTEDTLLTARLRGGADLVGIVLLDHIIVGDGKYHSFKEECNL